MAVAPIPQGYHTVTAYLITNDAAKAIEFYKKAFGAEELFRFPMPDGKIGHAEIRIGDSNVMLADAMEGFRDPHAFGGTPVSFMVYVNRRRQHLLARRSRQAPHKCARWRTSSTAIAPARSPIPSAMCGPSPRTSRTCRRKR